MRILFWGTPDFGLPSLEAMERAGHELVGVVTNPDRPAGRGRRTLASPVKRWAESRGLPVLQQERPRGEEFLAEMRALDPEIGVVAAYGQILVDEVLAAPPRGSINVHASLLPELRGAAPVNWAIIRGHAESGVTIMRMVRELDAGPMLLQEAIPLSPRVTAGELYERCSRVGAELLVRALAGLEAGTIEEIEQDHERATYAPKLGREEARLDWAAEAGTVERWIRGCDPWPGAWSELEGEPIQLFEPTVEPDAGDGPPGLVLEADPKTGLLVAAGKGAVRVGAVKPAGRRRMPSADWARGRPGLTGAVLV